MGQRKLWTSQEDNLLVKIMEKQGTDSAERKLKWNQVANLINELSGKSTRKGKQCRQRWFNQLHPNINKEQEWQPEEQQRLFQLQGQFGNHWSRIAKGLPGRSDNNIKNYFYSCLRKALRKVNSYLYNNKRVPQYKNIKPFQKNTVSKILTVAQKNAENKLLIAKEQAPELAKHIKNLLIKAQLGDLESQHEGSSQLMPQIISNIQQFNRICKRKKKKKGPSEKKEQQMMNQESEEEPQLSKIIDKQSSYQEKIQIKNEEHLSSQLIKNFTNVFNQQDCQGSQPKRKEHPNISRTYSCNQIIVRPKQVKNGVIIPLVRCNSIANVQAHISQPQKILGQTIPTATDMENLQQSLQLKQRSFVPCVPTLTFSYYQKNHILANGFIQAQSSSKDMKNHPSINSQKRQNYARSLEMFSLESLAEIFGKSNPIKCTDNDKNY